MEESIKETNQLYFTVNGIAAIAFNKDSKRSPLSLSLSSVNGVLGGAQLQQCL